MQINSGLSASLSGLAAASTEVEAAAYNVANVNTEGFKAIRVVEVSAGTEGSGVTRRVERTTTPGPVALDESRGLVEQSNVDIADEAVRRVAASRAYEANVTVAEAISDMDGALLKAKA